MANPTRSASKRRAPQPRTLGEAIDLAATPDATIHNHPVAVELRAWHLKPARTARLAQLDPWKADHALAMKEDRGSDSLQAHLIKLVKTYRLPYAYHTHRSDMSEAGYPDWDLIGHPGRGQAYLELKAEKGKFSTAQIECIVHMRLAGLRVYWASPVDVFTGRLERLVASLTRSA